jgi:hypothetical protein
VVLAGVLAVVACAGAGWLVLHMPPPVPAEPDPAAGMAPAEAYARALDLGRGGRHFDSLPYFRRALAGLSRDFADIHVNHATALSNATVEFRGGPLPVPATRSSDQRVAFAQTAMRELAALETSGLPAEDRARIDVRIAEVLDRWGFVPEALQSYREAMAEAPAWELPRERARTLDGLLRHPDQEIPRP